VDIDLNANPLYAFMDVYQKNHYMRYRFAKKFMTSNMVCGDFACGSGYGSALLAKVTQAVVGGDIKKSVIDEISKRYASTPNLEFKCIDLRDASWCDEFDSIVSFETVEHVEEFDIPKIMENFSKALKPDGLLIFSTPYMQKRSKEAMEMGFHLTFDINEEKISGWLEQAKFTLVEFYYQNYSTHTIKKFLDQKDIILCIARKI
jgi:2-polyprenyl-3-methyl-5-hydroxy-6-metoxy-1,4-benzoquinol methylase